MIGSGSGSSSGTRPSIHAPIDVERAAAAAAAARWRGNSILFECSGDIYILLERSLQTHLEDGQQRGVRLPHLRAPTDKDSESKREREGAAQ